MSKPGTTFVSLLFMSLLLFLGCSRDNHPPFQEDEGPLIDDSFLIDRVYDYQNRVIGEFRYGKRNQIEKMIHYFYDMDVQRREYEFKYDPKGAISRYVQSEYHSRGSGSKNVDIRLNEQGNVLRIKEESHVSPSYFLYSPDGLYKCRSNNENNCPEYSPAFTYNAAGNMIQRIDYIVGTPPGGTVKENINRYTYDDKNKPSIGLDELWFLSILPHVTPVISNNLSTNNVVGYEMVGYPTSWYKWAYTYDEYDRPITIEVSSGFQPQWPESLIRIEYKK